MYTERRLPSGAVLWRSNGGASAVIPADGCVDVIVLDGEPVIAGPSTRALQTCADGPAGSIGLRLAAGQAAPLLGIALVELVDQLVPLEAVGPRSPIAPWGRALLTMLDRPTTADDNALVVGDLDRTVHGVGPTPAWTVAVRRWAAGHCPVTLVTDELGVSERTLRRRMTDSFGYGYMTLTRIERARRARTLLLRGVSPSEAAAATGYADQPHLTREFRRLVGRSPAQVADGAKKSIALPSGSRNVAYR